MAANRQLLPTMMDESGSQLHKRRKRNKERLRVTRACDRCKKRKIKCNGTQPCEFCVRVKIQCTYDAAYARGRAPDIPPVTGNGMHATGVDSQDDMVSNIMASSSVVSGTAITSSELVDHNLASDGQNISSTYEETQAPPRLAASSQQTPEPPQEDLQGHYIGPASGVSFLLRVQKRLHKAIEFSAPSSIFTFGDAPISPPDFDPSFCMVLPREDGQKLLDRYFDFAMPTYRFLHRPTLQDWFDEFYDTLGTMRDVHNATARIALLFMIFAHARVYMPENARPGPADLSVSLGRPRSFHDDDIDTELPACVEDHEITRESLCTSSMNRGYSIMLAPVAHMNRRAEDTQSISQDLSDWRAELSRFLDADFFSTSLIVPIFQRQRNVLNLTYWHAIILTRRQCLLNNFAQISQQGRRPSNTNMQTKERIDECLVAAMDTMNTIDDMTQSGQMYHAFWVAYFGFTAAMVLYIYVIQEWASPPETYRNYFAAAARCQSHMATIAQKGSLVERYYLVLEELRVEALRQMKRLHPALGFGSLEIDAQLGGIEAMAIPVGTSPSTGTNYAEIMGEATIGFNGMGVAGIEEFSGWGQFASMVSSGLGNLDIFHYDDTFGL
ncbi:fungal specific transcription factor domain-containing protein [Verticillium dahliae VdLs.17]|uniref:Fungal specific transcription factor domain-containing protein n=1 Tax=Verticillium dahliae (strain VdLs.17 / ATCC MYA-4575 / FGSC 10137) TaxID=498257 RepID=G2WVR8_VERDV|nr:fungal specific transcription factor domain-containing protein [Verticillium dahliae VdLs.17]EGY19688.1 fungal specific transcription factor domain-containing protein [Verticillium dahliae VdLs.17]KAH6705987.1 fungal-specific transcription factor domain-containing protein [Verticillium dahliae]